MGVSDLVKQFSGDNGETRQVELCIYVVLAIGIFLVLLGSSRRRCSNVLLRFLTMLSQLSSFTLITFIVGLMVSAPAENIFFPIWAAYLAIFYGIPDRISAYSPEDNEQWRKCYFGILIELFWVSMVIGSHGPRYSAFLTVTIVILMPMLFSWKALERVQALGYGSKDGLARASKFVADFMSYGYGYGKRDRESSPSFKEGFQYLVGHVHQYKGLTTCTPGGESRINVKNDKVITVGKVWNCEGRLLSTEGNPGSKMKDLCLSFSLYNILCCHFAGYSFPQSTRDKQCEFVRDVLLQDVGNDENRNSEERPFQVIELELGYLFDHLYTKYKIISEKPWGKVCRFIGLCLISFVIEQCFLIPLENPIMFLQQYEQDVKDIVMLQHYILVTRIIIGVVVCLETLQLLLFAVSNWGKLLYLCKFVEKPSWRNNKLYEQFVRVACNFPSQKLWARELGQYYFLESFDKNRALWINNRITKSLLENPGVRSTRVTLSPGVRRAVLGWIKRLRVSVTNGRTSLIDNGIENKELLSACDCDKISRVIMVWHIATSLCEFKHSKSLKLSGDEEKYVVSMTLSKYCAYLVVFSPRLIPDHSIDTIFLFKHSVLVADALMKGCKSTESKCAKIMHHAEMDRAMKERSVVGAGGRVAKLLMEEVGDDEERLWKILANFWTEMVLFVAPCDDPWPHAECLAQGGEFVTHLWALLFHSGISTRECIQNMVDV